MIVAFKHMFHDNDLIDTLISFCTISKFIHCQIIFSNDNVGSSWPETGVTLRPYKDVFTYPFLFTYITVDELDEEATYRHFEANLGKKFDMIGSLAPFLNRSDKKHCSEICYEALKKGGLKCDRKASRINPQTLFDILTEQGNKDNLISGNQIQIMPKHDRFYACKTI